MPDHPALARPALASLALPLALFAGGCKEQHSGPIDASVVGPPAKILDPARNAFSEPTGALLGAIAQGLVRFDANGQIEPGVAERWIVSDDGKSYIFRIGDLYWTDGERVTSDAVARRLRAAISARSRHPDRTLFDVVDEVLVMTDRVIEIRLKAPRPNLLQLLAQPEMALLSGRDGTGPLMIERAVPGGQLLTPVDDRNPETPAAPAEDKVVLRGERVGKAIARYRMGRSQLVLGGTYDTLLTARLAEVPARELRVDPARGLFGIAILSGEGFLAERDNRVALSMAIDRDALLARFEVRGWAPMVSLTPEQMDSASAPAVPAWSGMEPAERRLLAATTVAVWRRTAEAAPRLRMAVAPTPGARMLFLQLRADWAAIGVALVPAADEKDADLALVDDVAPMDSTSWYLDRLSCARDYPCDPVAEEKRLLARAARTLQDRAVLLAEAEAAASGASWFLPVATPLRWSLVAPGLDAFRENARAVHPLNRLRQNPR